MTKESLAKLLNGREYGAEITNAECRQAKEAGLVVLFGASDDLAEFRGAIEYEMGSCGDFTIRIADVKVLERHEDCECEYCGFDKLKERAVEIKALWDKNGYSWSYETKIPHATFEIMEGKEKYCRGIVFDLAGNGLFSE